MPSWRLSRAVSDLLIGQVAMGLSFFVRTSFPLPFTTGLLPQSKLAFYLVAAILVALTQNVVLYFFGFYELSHPRPHSEGARRLLAAIGLQGLLLISYYFLSNQPFPRTIVILFVLTNGAMLLVSRALLDRVLAPQQRRVAIVGQRDRAQLLANEMGRHPRSVEVVGLVEPKDAAPSLPSDDTDDTGGELASERESEHSRPLQLIGDIDDLPRLVRDGVIDEVVVTARTPGWQTRLLDELSASQERAVNVLLLPDPFESLLGRMKYRSVNDIPLIEVTSGSLRRSRLLKRSFDLVAAPLLVIATLPLLLAAMLSIAVLSPGPVIYRQQRVGLGGREFTLWKLRTMAVNAEGDTEQLASRNDPRITKVGKILRSLRLDELPQLWNVLNGSMSLVGPRPERPGFVQRYLNDVPGYATRFTISPGLTGLAQVNGDYHTNAENKLRYDLAYLANWSLWLDVAILLRTVRIVLTSRGI